MNSISLKSPGKKEYTFEIPANWDELTTPELEMVSGLLTSDEKDSGKIAAAIFAGLLHIRALNARANLGDNWLKRISPEDVGWHGLDAISFLFEKSTRTINPYPSLRLEGITGRNSAFAGPANAFEDITCGQMEDAETILTLAGENITTDTLASLAAIFWQIPPAERNIDSWKPGDEYLAKKAERLKPNFAKLSKEKLTAILYWYSGCRNLLPQLFPNVYGKEGKGKADPAAFTKCIHAGAGNKNGTREQIRKMIALEFLFDMNNEAKIASDNEREIKKTGKKN